MINLIATTDNLELVTDAAVTVDVVAEWVDISNAVPPVIQDVGRTATLITTATTTTIVAAPGGTNRRNVKTLTIRNRHATTSVGVTLQLDVSGTNYERHKVTLLAGEMLEFVEGVGFFVATTTRKLNCTRRVSADVINATTSFADVTGLTVPVSNGKHYNFEAHLFHLANATTTGAFFAVNGPTMTSMRLLGIDVVTPAVATAAWSANVADITARDTNVSVETTSAVTPVLAILSGWINPSADGTFAIRCASEVAVAAGITVKIGSWLHIWEPDA